MASDRDYAPREGPSKQLPVRFPCDIMQWLEAKAAEEGRSLGAVVKRCVRQAMQETAA